MFRVKLLNTGNVRGYFFMDGKDALADGGGTG